MKPLGNEDYARRYLALVARIERMYPYPTVPYDDAEGDWKHARRRRDRQLRRITELPKRWRGLAR